jgi:hypothetical protein
VDGLNLNLEDGRYQIVVFMSDRKRQLGNVSDIPISKEELKRHQMLLCEGLTVEIEDSSPPQRVLQALQDGEWNEETRKDVLKLIGLSFHIHDGIVEYFRNLADQIWLDPFSADPNSQETVEHSLRLLRAEWLDANGNWSPLTVNQKPFLMTWRGYFGRGVDPNEWRQVEAFVQQFVTVGSRAPIVDVFLANAFRHLEQENGRLAVVEAVIALEASLKEILPKLITGFADWPEIDEKLVDELIKAAGLSLTVKVILRGASKTLGISDSAIATIQESIAVRNNIVHQKQRVVPTDRAREYLRQIRIVIGQLRRQPVEPRSKVIFSIDPVGN